MEVDQDGFQRAYALLALRADHAVRASGGESGLIYAGPEELPALVAGEPPRPVPELVAECDRLLADLPYQGSRRDWLAAQLTATRAVLLRHAGRTAPLQEYAEQVLGLAAPPVAEAELVAAHDRIAAALPAGPGDLADRFQAWQRRHRLDTAQLPAALDRTLTETITRTRRLVELPDDVAVEVRLRPGGAHRGAYLGGHRGTLYFDDAQPANAADLIHVIAHEGFPGHIAEQLIKSDRSADRPEFRIRLLYSPPFLVSEGIGLHAPEMIFPGDEAQRWLTEHVLRPAGIEPDGSDFATIHRARNVLWGAWGNAAHLLAEGRPEAEAADQLRRWGLLGEAEVAWALGALRSPEMQVYVLGYHHGWKLLDRWLGEGDRASRFRRLLTEPMLPSDLRPTDPAPARDITAAG